MKYMTFLSLILIPTSCSFSSDHSSTLDAAVELADHNLSKSSVDDADDLDEIHFTELWIWEYLNEDREWKEMWAYRAPHIDYWLLERQSSFGESSEMCEWVMAKPNGEYFLSYQEPEMNTPNTIDLQTVEFYDDDELSDFWKATGKTKKFGDSVHGQDVFVGEQYEVSFKGQPDPSLFYLSITDINMNGLYYFNSLDGDIQLPISFPLGIPNNILVLSEQTDFEYYNMKVSYRFKEISPTSYYVYLPKE